MDKVDLEVLKRSGTATEKKYAARIMPVRSSNCQIKYGSYRTLDPRLRLGRAISS